MDRQNWAILGNIWQRWAMVAILDIGYKFDFSQRRVNMGNISQFGSIIGEYMLG